MSSSDTAIAQTASQTLGGVEVGSPIVRGALLLSLWDGTFATVMVALTETFGIAAAVSLKAPSMAIALLGSTPLLVGSLGQYFLPALVDMRADRKRFVLAGVGLQSALLLVTAFTGFVASPFSAWAFVTCLALSGASANVTGASWVAWMGDLVPLAIRGRHFAWRNRLFAFVNLSCALFAGISARDYEFTSAPWNFFTLVFLTAGIARLFSYQCLKRQYEPPLRLPSKRPHWRVYPSKEFKTFCLAHALVQGAAAMSGPFFTVWYLRDLHFNYFELAIVSCSIILGNIVALPLWGKLADHIGSRNTLRIAGFLVSMVPIPYLGFTSQAAVWVINVGGGVAWAGYNLVSFNYMLSASENCDRTRLFAYASALTGVVVFSMTLLGGLLSTWLPVLFSWQLQTLFLVSAVLRLLTFAYFFPRLEEYSSASGRPAQDLFNEIPGYRVGLGLLRNFFRAFRG